MDALKHVEGIHSCCGQQAFIFRFAARHTIDECVAKGMNLPTSLMERRKRRALVYCTREYFYFICVIESIYLANLTLQMMLAYNDGDISPKSS